MKHATVDRAAVDRPGHQQWAEVHGVVVDDRKPWSGWRYLVALTAIVAIAAWLLAPDLLRSRPAASRCVDTPGYGGLGAGMRAFDANNDNSIRPAGPTPGAAWYFVTATAHGCVSGFALRDAGSPPLTARELLFLVGNPLPRDARRVASTETCAVWRSASLKRAIGRPYAVARASGQAGPRAGTAEIAVNMSPAC
ncbi:MAG TPA: hypothetical protein VKT31_06125 [Solirubrobacteraceae bacterium]|nr:hypothetical protein [Solirubrobacteraceae bacterium]